MTLGLPPGAVFLRAHALIEPMSAGLELVRAHPHVFGSTQFDARPHAHARFSTVHHRAGVVPVVYAGADRAAAASETIFHTVEAPGGSVRPRRVYLSKYLEWQWSPIITTRDLRLVRLDDAGLASLGTTRTELITSGDDDYPTTRPWAEALLEACEDADGFWWFSRQAPGRRAFVLYRHTAGRSGGLVAGDLAGRGPALPFAIPPGLEELDAVALELDITVLRA